MPTRPSPRLVLCDVPEAERQPACLPEALRPHLVGADAGGDRQHPVADELLGGGRSELDVTGDHADNGTTADQIRCARLRLRRVRALRVTRDDLEPATVPPALRV